jgi:hypothetical protein
LTLNGLQRLSENLWDNRGGALQGGHHTASATCLLGSWRRNADSFCNTVYASGTLAIRGKQLRQHCCYRLRARDYIVIIELPAKRCMSGDLGVPDPEIGMRRVIPQPVLARATLDL